MMALAIARSLDVPIIGYAVRATGQNSVLIQKHEEIVNLYIKKNSSEC